MKKIVSILIITAIMLSVFPFSSVVFASDTTPLSLKSFKDSELFDSLALQNGTMTKAELEKATLPDDDVPSFVDRSFLEENDSVKRLQNKEEELNALVYQNKDGTLSKMIFSENIKFKDDKGNIKDKSNRLEFNNATSSYVNPDNDVNVRLPKKVSANAPISVTYDEYKIDIMPNGTAADGVKVENTVRYNGVFGNETQLVYTPLFSGIKEDIILNSLPSDNEFEFIVEAVGLELVCIDGEYVLTDTNGDVKAYFGELVIYDSNGTEGTGAVNAVQNENGSILYTITVDDSFLQTASYPVTVDPAVLYTATSDIVDSEIKSGSTSMNPSSSRIIIGKTSSSDSPRRMIIKLPSAANYVMNRIDNIEDVESVKYYMYCCNNETTPIPTLDAYRMTESWGSTSTTVSSTLFSSYSTAVREEITIPGAESYSYYGIELLKIFKQWKSGSPNYGIMLKSSDESQKNYMYVRTMEYSTTERRPYVVVRYSEDFAETPTAGVSDKGLYRISTTETTKRYITRTQSSSSHIPSVQGVINVTGSTKPQSQYVAINYVGNGRYTLSFAITEGENMYLQADDNDNISLVSSITYSNGSYNNYGLWHIVYNSIGTSYTFVNVGSSSSYLTYNNDNSLSNRPSTISDGDRWYLTKVGMDVPIIMQRTDDWCSAATSLQILTYFDLDGEVSGIDISAKQNTLYNEAGGENMLLYMLVNLLNDNYFDALTYKYYKYTAMSNINTMHTYISGSLNGNCPVALLVKPRGYLPSYYTGYSSEYGHYICLVGYDSVTDNYILRDCNCLGENNGYPYLGEFIVTKNELHTAIINTGGYIICKQ